MSHLNPIFGRETSQWLFTDMLYRIHIAMSGIWTLVVICTDFLEKSTNRTITSSPCPQYKWEEDLEYTWSTVRSRRLLVPSISEKKIWNMHDQTDNKFVTFNSFYNIESKR